MRFFAWFSGFHPRVYAITYMVSILFFAFLYSYAAPGGFVAPNARYEGAAIEQANQLKQSLAQAISEGFTIYHLLDIHRTNINGDKITLDGQVYDVSSIRVISIYPEDNGTVQLELFINSSSCCTNLVITDSINLTLDIQTTSGIAIGEGNTDPWELVRVITYSSVGSDAPGGPDRINKLGPVLFSNQFITTNHDILPIKHSALSDLQDYASGFLGRPHDLSGKPYRMLYLSGYNHVRVG